MMQGMITHTNHPDERHFVRTNQLPTLYAVYQEEYSMLLVAKWANIIHFSQFFARNVNEKLWR